MYKHIMVPVDLAHAESIDKAIATAADLAKRYDARLTLIGVTLSGPSSVAHTPEEYARRLEAFAAEQGERHGVAMVPHTVVDPDPVVELDGVLKKQIEALGVDLVVMASHVPDFRDLLFHSNAGYLATHTAVSVFIVR